ncbi:hypothetical protein [uncultured Alistipes sp.]|uniref:hypothetical protein n=1 Tax=uncultured Alistipes sp. TaxID=538949 RepID=UPI00258BD564|nr:hypothetical protein [uncultured Alistipes sp.]
MKKALFLFAALACAGFGSAQEITADTVRATPPYYYCEIIAGHLPTHRSNGVLFDFGQKTGAWKYNYLTDAAGNKLLFSSGMDAVNYMGSLGWEFVQAYASGKDNDISHYVLRITPARLATTQREALLAPPEREKPRKEK